MIIFMDFSCNHSSKPPYGGLTSERVKSQIDYNVINVLDIDIKH